MHLDMKLDIKIFHGQTLACRPFPDKRNPSYHIVIDNLQSTPGHR